MDIQRRKNAIVIISVLCMVLAAIFNNVNFVSTIWTRSATVLSGLYACVVVIAMVIALWRRMNPFYRVPILREYMDWRSKRIDEETKRSERNQILIVGSITLSIIGVLAYVYKGPVPAGSDLLSSWDVVVEMIVVKMIVPVVFGVVIYFSRRREERRLLQEEQERLAS